MAQSVGHLTLGFGSGRDPTVCEIEPHVELCADGREAAWDSLSLSPSLSLRPSPLSLSLCSSPAPDCSVALPVSLALKINKLF